MYRDFVRGLGQDGVVSGIRSRSSDEQRKVKFVGEIFVSRTYDSDQSSSYRPKVSVGRMGQWYTFPVDTGRFTLRMGRCTI